MTIYSVFAMQHYLFNHILFPRNNILLDSSTFFFLQMTVWSIQTVISFYRQITASLLL